MERSRFFLWLTLAGSLLIALALITACQPAAGPEPQQATAVPTAVPPPTAVPTEPPTPEPVDQSSFHEAWLSGVHGSTYGLGKGPNTYCSRCHSPQNWDPTSSVSAAPNCVTCKFATDPEVRMAETMAFVEEADWKGIGCETCHQVDANGVVSEGFAWLNPITMENEALGSPNELCGKCHATTSGVKFTGGRGVDHQIVLGGSAHLNYAGEWPQANRPHYCTDCHNPHSGQPTQCDSCHAVRSLDTHIMGKNAEHANVSCLACHDASGLDVGPHPDEAMGGLWVNVVTSTGRGGTTTTSYVKSHSIQWDVSCDRCHFAENPWELNVYTADGQVPSD